MAFLQLEIDVYGSLSSSKFLDELVDINNDPNIFVSIDSISSSSTIFLKRSNTALLNH